MLIPCIVLLHHVLSFLDPLGQKNNKQWRVVDV